MNIVFFRKNLFEYFFIVINSLKLGFEYGIDWKNNYKHQKRNWNHKIVYYMYFHFSLIGTRIFISLMSFRIQKYHKENSTHLCAENVPLFLLAGCQLCILNYEDRNSNATIAITCFPLRMSIVNSFNIPFPFFGLQFYAGRSHFIFRSAPPSDFSYSTHIGNFEWSAREYTGKRTRHFSCACGFSWPSHSFSMYHRQQNNYYPQKCLLARFELYTRFYP